MKRARGTERSGTHDLIPVAVRARRRRRQGHAAGGGTGPLLAGQREQGDLGLGLPRLGLDGIGPYGTHAKK